MNTIPRIPPLEGGFTQGLFRRTAQKLISDESAYHSVLHFGMRGKLQQYRSVIDFLLCELWHLPWKTRCSIYYRNHTSPDSIYPSAIKDEGFLKLSTQYDAVLSIFILERIKEIEKETPNVGWRSIRKIVEKTYHLERSVATYTYYT
jgi:hypothetical protein